MAQPNTRMLFVNLPVRDLQRAKEFFTQLGFEYNPKFTDDKAACMIISSAASVMLLTKEYFETFIKKPVSDASKQTEAMFALSCQSRAEVDDMVKKALACRRQARTRPGRSRLHVRLDLPRSRRSPLGGGVDGSGGRRLRSRYVSLRAARATTERLRRAALALEAISMLISAELVPELGLTTRTWRCAIPSARAPDGRRFAGADRRRGAEGRADSKWRAAPRRQSARRRSTPRFG
jgi:predicted lactoylglutathione lyase